jgi:uncharacterized protein YbbC (DUF1343 family)/CubicO group peptidase (beta-lactamase class C family)
MTVASPEAARLPPDVVASIDAAIEAAIEAHKLPGCVLVIGRHDAVLLSKAYGSRSLEPVVTPMTLDTVFDLASLTKPIATAASIVLLADQRQLDLDAPLRAYLSELGPQGNGTLRQALTHTAGFVADTPLSDYDHGIDEAVRRIAARPLAYPPGKDSRYSDVGFLLLAEIVRRVGGRDFDAFVQREVLRPLAMHETTFVPTGDLASRAAPTENVDGRWLSGEVHDPRARRLGGVAGHAGLFSTGKDLTTFAQALLSRGAPFLSPHAFQAFTARHDVPRGIRALGWDIQSTFSVNRGTSLSPRAFGHGGYTGTALWIDPEKDLFVVFLSNRVHPDGHGAVNPLVGAIVDLAAGAVRVDERAPPARAAGAPRQEAVLTGLDVLEDEHFARLRGAHVGLLTNATGVSRHGERDIDLLAGAEGVTLRAVFTPEHGLSRTQDARIGDSQDEKTGLPIYSLYGEHLSPTPAQLDGIDTLVINLPDVGVRFFTYASTMHRALVTAASRGLKVVVLDRPNPQGGLVVEGPLVDAPRTFVNHANLPILHGMTMGELALLFDAQDHLGTELEIVRMRGWAREDRWADTGLPWSPPSPNLRTADEALLYPGVALVEPSNVSVGRGTESPFEVVGAPWINGAALVRELERAGLKGIELSPTAFTPASSRYAGSSCAGVRLRLTDATAFDPIALGVALAEALARLYPSAWKLREIAPIWAWPPALEAIRRQAPIEEVAATWGSALAEFKATRGKYLLYPVSP